jgi:sulfate transport system permease protein
MNRRGILPGFGLSYGIALSYLSLIVLLPLSTIPIAASDIGWRRLWEIVCAPRSLAAFRLSLTAAFAAALLNVVSGTLVAWVLERYRFPLRRLVDGLVDLPFALPTAVAGIALTTLYAENGWVGSWLAKLGLKVAYTPLGVVVALTFVGLPFVVRTVQPVLRGLRREVEEAAASLGAGRVATIGRVLLPEILPAAATGFTLAFARGLGEYGSVIFIAGNLPLKSEVTPLLIMIRLEEFDYAAASALATVSLLASFLMLLAINRLMQWQSRSSEGR